jgi:hypothetical protein
MKKILGEDRKRRSGRYGVVKGRKTFRKKERKKGQKDLEELGEVDVEREKNRKM